MTDYETEMREALLRPLKNIRVYQLELHDWSGATLHDLQLVNYYSGVIAPLNRGAYDQLFNIEDRIKARGKA